MINPNRMILAALLTLSLAGQTVAQAPATSEPAAAETTTTVTTETASGTQTTATGEPAAEGEVTARKSSYEVRNEFSHLLRQTPSEVASIFVLDPTMLSNEPFLSAYPDIAEYLAQHPEIQRNPRFYLADFATRPRETAVDEIFEMFAIMVTFGLVAFALMWIIRTIIEQKRWNRLSKQQSEVHNKILDRFGTSSELLEYVKSPAGTKFLESAPIPLHAEQPTHTVNRPLTRVMWSIQIGVIVGAAALGMLAVSLRFEKEAAEGMFAMGAILMSIGLGFIGSAAVSLFVSRRLGLWDSPPNRDGGGDHFIEPGHVR